MSSPAAAPISRPSVTARILALHARLTLWNRARLTRNAICKLSLHELDDLGLNRANFD